MSTMEEKGCAFRHLRPLARALLTGLILTTAAIAPAFLSMRSGPVVDARQAVLETAAVPEPAPVERKSGIAGKPAAEISNDETGFAGVRSSFVRSSAVTNGWQYCLAVSPMEKKVFISAAFPKNLDLKLAQALFAETLTQAEHDPVQCPVAKYPGTARMMREDAIGFNRKVGNAVVSLNWEPLSLPKDEDPVDAVLYTGNSSSDVAEDRSAWRYCFAQSNADKKSYFTTAFPKASTLHADEKEFEAKLSQLKLSFDTVQCPNSADEPSISAMRERAIGFNEERGQTIVTLTSGSQS